MSRYSYFGNERDAYDEGHGADRYARNPHDEYDERRAWESGHRDSIRDEDRRQEQRDQEAAEERAYEERMAEQAAERAYEEEMYLAHPETSEKPQEPK